MPSVYYKRNFVQGYYYHIYNRGSRKSNVFLDNQDFDTFIDIIKYYLQFPQGIPLSWKNRTKNSEKDTCKVRNLVNYAKSSFSIVCFCLLSNHFHLLIKQNDHPEKENSIINFMRRISITYSMYFIDKYNHSGNLFQGKYKNILVDNDRQLLYLTKYIHQNPSEALKNNHKLQDYKYSSYSCYLGIANDHSWVNKVDILNLFSSEDQEKKYREFVENEHQDHTLLGKTTLENNG